MTESFSIVFVQGVDFTAKSVMEFDYFVSTIKGSFCLLSWLIPDYSIRILEEFILDDRVKVKLFTKKGDPKIYSLYERAKEGRFYYALDSLQALAHKDEHFRKLAGREPQLAIKAEFQKQEEQHEERHDDEVRKFNRLLLVIKVTVQKEAQNDHSFQRIFVDAEDQQAKDRFGRYNYFKPPCRKLTDDDGDYTDIQYYYIEPENRRFHTPEGYHLSLAFQGGGAKGVSYVGVYKAIQQLQRRIQRDSKGNIPLPITSVIGSSAGGILSLAISAGISEEDLISLCYMMDTLVEDRLISNEEMADEAEKDPSAEFNNLYEEGIEPHFFTEQGKAVKNLLHNLGLAQESLTSIIFETLKDPSVQGKIVDLLKALNPSIASLLTFDDTEKLGSGNAVKESCCCCCCYSICWTCCGLHPCCKSIPGNSCFVEDAQNLKKVNIYGLLYAALMTGSAVENILAYALSCFFGMQALKRSEKLGKLAVRKGWFQNENEKGVLARILEESDRLRDSYKAYRQSGKKDKAYLTSRLMAVAKELTLKEYYQLIGVEFTCTSVDLHDRIERFFNHKTTPHLPICKAVQMTGSFPVAFLSLAWKQSWGKYYVHYDKSRREIDLTGHHFTDGGLLANFPLKFLDNQKFREKYLSHKGVPGKTLLYGFGLDKLNDFPQFDNSNEVSGKMASLVEEIKYRIMYKLMVYLMKCGSKSMVEVKTSKVITFLLELLDALRDSDRNLNKECFNNEIVLTTFKKQAITSVQQYRDISNKAADVIKQLNAIVQTHTRKQMQELLDDQINSIYHRFTKYRQARQPNTDQYQYLQTTFNRKLSWQAIQNIQWRLEDNFLLLSPKIVPIYQQTLQDMKNKHARSNIFVTSATRHHELEILEMLYQIWKGLMLDAPSHANIKNTIIASNVEFVQELKDVYKIVSNKLSHFTSTQSLEKEMFIDHLQAKKLINLMYKLSPFCFKAFKQKAKLLFEKSPLFNFHIEEETFLNKGKIKFKIRNQILFKKAKIEEESKRIEDERKQKEYSQEQLKKGKKNEFPTQLHIILQSHYFSHYYYPNYLKIVEEVISDKSLKPLKVNILSCSDYHAIFGVFYVMGLDMGKTKQRLSEVQSLFEQNPNIDQVYDSKEWMKSSVEQMRTLIEQEWKKHANPFEVIESEYNEYTNSSLGRNQKYAHINSIEDKFEASEQDMSSAFEKILNYISGSLQEVAKLPPKDKNDRFEQLLSIGKYKSANSQASKNGQRILEHFLTYTANLLMVAGEFILKSQQFTLLSKQCDREKIFKGLVINCLISAFKYKIYIYDLLGQAGFDRNVTLSKFYDTCDRKILLNFNCVNTTQQRFSTINKITKPNMPLWAALMAAASLPYLEGQFQSRKEWELKEQPDRNLDKADLIFSNFEAEGADRGNNYISANYISSLPLEFMTNKRLINAKLTVEDNPPVIEIAFAFQSSFPKVNQSLRNNLTSDDSRGQIIKNSMHQQAQPAEKSTQVSIASILDVLPYEMEGKRKFTNCCDALGYICEYLCCCCCDASVGSYFGDLAGRLSSLKMLNVRINSHDNLILHLYYDILIKLPLRIDTLDFFKISTARPDLSDTIRQGYEVVRELCDTITVARQDPTRISYAVDCQPNLTTIQFSYHRSAKYLSNNPFYRIKFISYTKWRDYKYKYAIEYATNIEGLKDGKLQWATVKEDHFDILRSDLFDNHNQILLRFTFYTYKLKAFTYLLSLQALTDLKLQPSLDAESGHQSEVERAPRALVTFPNAQIYCRKLDILTLNQQPLKKAIFIKSSSLPSDSQHCSNLECNADVLSYVLMRQSSGICFQCRQSYILANSLPDNYKYQKKELIAMECSKCKVQYCLKCKISNFIQREYRHEAESDTFALKCPKNKVEYDIGYAPIQQQFLGGPIVPKNNCHYCGRYSYKLWFEKEISSGQRPPNQFCGLKICEACILYISN